MLTVLLPWPTTRWVMGARWCDRLRTGERGGGWVGSVDEGWTKERRAGRDQTWMLESGEPERRKLPVGSTATLVTAWRCERGVEIDRPVQSYIC